MSNELQHRALARLRRMATVEEGDFRAWDTMAVELEVAEFLYGLVRASKPRLVIEVGSGNGYASVFIASALEENGFGGLVTYEQDPVYADRAERALSGFRAMVVREWSTVYQAEGDAKPDLVFIDSLGGEMGRDDDIYYWLTLHAGAGFVVVVHDANGIPDLPETGVRLGAGRGVWIGHA